MGLILSRYIPIDEFRSKRAGQVSARSARWRRTKERIHYAGVRGVGKHRSISHRLQIVDPAALHQSARTGADDLTIAPMRRNFRHYSGACEGAAFIGMRRSLPGELPLRIVFVF